MIEENNDPTHAGQSQQLCHTVCAPEKFLSLIILFTGAQQIDPLTSEWLHNLVAKGIALALHRSWVRIQLKTPENFFRCTHEIVTETVQQV